MSSSVNARLTMPTSLPHNSAIRKYVLTRFTDCCILSSCTTPQRSPPPHHAGGRMTITFEPLNETARLMLANGLEDALQRMNHSTDSLHADLDRLAIQVEKLVTERQHII